MAAAQERSLVRLGRFVGINLSPQPPQVERERLSFEDLIDLGAFPIADGHALLFPDSPLLDMSDTNTDNLERIGVYFQTIANIRLEQIEAKRNERPSRSLYGLSPIVITWDKENGSRLGYSLSTWDKDSETFEYKGFLPLLRLGSIVDQNRIDSPLTHEQLSDALAYLVDSNVLSQKKKQDVLDRHGKASRQYQAALEIESRRVRIPKLPEHDNRPLWEVSPLIDAYNPDDDNSIRDNIRRVLILADQIRAYGDIDKKTGKSEVTVSIKTKNGTRVAIVSIPRLGIDQGILRDHYISDEEIINGKMITESDLVYALGYLEDSGVITLEQKVLIGGRDESEGLFKPQKLRKLIPLKEDPGEKFRELVPEYPYYIESGNGGNVDDRNSGRIKSRLLQHYNLGRYEVYVAEPLAKLNFILDVFMRREPVFVFHLSLSGLGQNEIRTKLALVQAYHKFANTHMRGRAQREQGVNAVHSEFPILYRDQQDHLLLAMDFKGSILNDRFTQRDMSEKRVVPLQMDTQVRTVFEQTLQQMVAPIFSGYLSSAIRITPTRVVHPRGDKPIAVPR